MTTQTAEASYPRLRVSNTALTLLVLCYMMSLFDRQVLSLLVAPIKADLHLTDFQFSLLQGLAFVFLYSVAGLFLGYLADKVSRRNLLATCLTTWSLATIGNGLSANFAQMFAARVVVGVGEAGGHPSIFSLLCDLYAPKHRGRAFGVMGVFGSLGMAIALLGGAAVYHWVSENHDILPAMLQSMAPWRLTFLFAGLPGLVLAALLMLVTKEPVRRTDEHASAEKTSMKAFLVANRRFLIPLIAYFTMYNFCCYVVLGWSPAYYMRRFGTPIYEVGLITGVLFAVGGLGGMVTGLLGDRWIARRAYAGRLRAAVVSVAVGVPAVLVWFLSPNMTLSVIGGIFGYGAFSVTMTAVPLILADVTPNQFRGRMTSIYLFFSTLIGVALGPVAVASLTDFVFKDEAKVNYSMIIATLCAMAVATACALGSMKRYNAALYRDGAQG